MGLPLCRLDEVQGMTPTDTEQGETWEFRIILSLLSRAITTSRAGSPPEREELVHGKSIAFATGRCGFSFLLCYRFSL